MNEITKSETKTSDPWMKSFQSKTKRKAETEIMRIRNIKIIQPRDPNTK